MVSLCALNRFLGPKERPCLLRVSLWNDICDIRHLSSKQGTSLHLYLQLVMHLLKDAPVRDATYRKLFRASPNLSNPALNTSSATVALSDKCRLIVVDSSYRCCRVVSTDWTASKRVAPRFIVSSRIGILYICAGVSITEEHD